MQAISAGKQRTQSAQAINQCSSTFVVVVVRRRAAVVSTQVSCPPTLCRSALKFPRCSLQPAATNHDNDDNDDNDDDDTSTLRRRHFDDDTLLCRTRETTPVWCKILIASRCE